MSSKHNRQRKRFEASKWIKDPFGAEFCSICGDPKKGHTEESCRKQNPYKHHESSTGSNLYQ